MHQFVARRAEAIIQEDAPPAFRLSQIGATRLLELFDKPRFTQVSFRKLRVSKRKNNCDGVDRLGCTPLHE